MKALFSLLVFGSALFAQAPAPSPAVMRPSALTARAPEVYKVNFATSKGNFVVEVQRAWAPRGADRFYNLAKNGFFNGAAFFRVLPKFIVQFGIPADPKVARVWQQAFIKDDPVTHHNTRGTLVFATAGPNTRTTQLFINLNDNTKSLDPEGFAPFGTIIEGMEVIEQFYSGYGEAPSENQARIQLQGKAYLQKTYPRLDTITSATVTSDAPAAAPQAAPKAAPKANVKGAAPAGKSTKKAAPGK